MRRIYFLVPDVPSARRVVDDLRAAGIETRHLHVLARRGTPLEDLPAAGVAQETEAFPNVAAGLGAGTTVGFLAGLLAVAIPGAGPVVAGGILLAATFQGAALGSLIGGMVGLASHDPRLEDYECAVENGRVLVMADVPAERVEAIEVRVSDHVPRQSIASAAAGTA
jgi:hypothetical protein